MSTEGPPTPGQGTLLVGGSHTQGANVGKVQVSSERESIQRLEAGSKAGFGGGGGTDVCPLKRPELKRSIFDFRKRPSQRVDGNAAFMTTLVQVLGCEMLIRKPLSP